MASQPWDADGTRDFSAPLGAASGSVRARTDGGGPSRAPVELLPDVAPYGALHASALLSPTAGSPWAKGPRPLRGLVADGSLFWHPWVYSPRRALPAPF